MSPGVFDNCFPSEKGSVIAVIEDHCLTKGGRAGRPRFLSRRLTLAK